MKLSYRETNTILAALRYWQAAMVTSQDSLFRQLDEEIAQDGGECESLDADEIDELCESLNGEDA